MGRGYYQIRVQTSAVPHGGSDADMVLKLNGSERSGDPFQPDNSADNFEQGNTDNFFSPRTVDLGEIESIEWSGDVSWSMDWTIVFFVPDDEVKTDKKIAVSKWLNTSTGWDLEANLYYIRDAGYKPYVFEYRKFLKPGEPTVIQRTVKYEEVKITSSPAVSTLFSVDWQVFDRRHSSTDEPITEEMTAQRGVSEDTESNSKSGYKIGASATVGYTSPSASGGANASSTLSAEYSKEVAKRQAEAQNLLAKAVSTVTFTAPKGKITAKCQVWNAMIAKSVFTSGTTQRDLEYPLSFQEGYDLQIEADTFEELLELAGPYAPQLRVRLESDRLI